MGCATGGRARTRASAPLLPCRGGAREGGPVGAAGFAELGDRPLEFFGYARGPHYSMVARNSPAVTVAPSLAGPESTRPVRLDFSSFCIFMASSSEGLVMV